MQQLLVPAGGGGAAAAVEVAVVVAAAFAMFVWEQDVLICSMYQLSIHGMDVLGPA